MHGFVINSVVLFLITILNERCLSDETPGKFVIKNSTSDLCPNRINFNVETKKYISQQDRYKLCKDNFPTEFDTDNNIRDNLLDCLGPSCNYTENGGRNPCIVECLFKDKLTSTFLPNPLFKGNNDGCSYMMCNNLKMDYVFDQRYIYITDTNQKCGPDHYCTSDGCCIESTQPSTDTPKPMPTTFPTITSTPETTTELVTTTEPLPTPEPELHCDSIGQYKYPNDPTNRKYYRCVLRAVEMMCPSGQVFDQNIKECKVPEVTTQSTPSTVTPTTPRITSTTSSKTSTSVSTTAAPVIDYTKYLKCDEEGMFRNPFNCSSFYRCYKYEHNRNWQIGVFACPRGMIFDDQMGNLSTCIPQDEFISKYHTHCIDKPLPGQRVTYLHCEEEGVFANPYKCGLFYKCLKNTDDQTLQVEEDSCIDDMVFDNLSKQCIDPSDYSRKYGPCQDKPITLY